MQDKELLELIENNSEKGYRQLIRQYSGLVYTIVYSKISSVCTKEDVEECAADVFMKFYKSISSFDPSKGSIKAFLSIIAKRTAITRFNELTKYNSELISIDDEENLVEELHAEEKDNELRETLIEAVKSLGEPDSTIIARKYFVGDRVKQIASELGLKEFAVHKRANRALVRLKQILMEVGYYE